METAKRAYADKIIKFKGKTRASDHALLRAVCSALYSAIAVGGLFLGYLIPGTLGKTIAGGDPILHGSLLGAIIEIVRGSLKMPAPAHGFAGVLPVILFFLVLVLLGVVLLSLVLTILAFLNPKRAKRYATVNGCCTCSVYLALFFGTLFCRSLSSETLERSAFDLPTLLTALSALCLLALTAIAEYGADGCVNALLALWSCAALFAFAIPASPLQLLLARAFYDRDPSAICCLAVFGSLLCDLALSLLRINAKRGRGFDVFRFALQFVAALVLAAVCVSDGMTPAALFEEPFSMMLLLLAPLCAFLVTVFSAAKNSVTKNQDKAKTLS